VQPVYRIFKGWNRSDGARKFEELPAAAPEYIAALEEMIGCRIGIISTSPEREDTIVRV
jgi:adenylosuccinate synthase